MVATEHAGLSAESQDELPSVDKRVFWYLRPAFRYALDYKLWAKWQEIKRLRPLQRHSRDFVPGEREWVWAHHIDIIRRFLEFARPPLDGTQALLDVGCGDSLTTYGLLRLPFRRVVGLDVVGAEHKALHQLPARIKRAGIAAPTEAQIAKFEHVHYAGELFPFADSTFDILFSWSAFEHVQAVRQVLTEMRRVMKPSGLAFVQVSPWFQTRYGSHLADYIAEPWFHLTWDDQQVRSRLEAVVQAQPESAEMVLGHLWPEYQSLNRYSADMFYADVRAAGWAVEKAEIEAEVEDLRQAPPGWPLSQLLIHGTMMVLRAD